MSQPPTFPPLAAEDWPEDLADLSGSFADRLNVYRVMAHHPALLRAWVPLRRHVVQNSALTEPQLEAVILRVAHRIAAPYEWEHHVIRAGAAGLSPNRIAALAGPIDAVDPEDAVFARAVDEMIDATCLGPQTQAALLARVGAPGVFDLIATVGFYIVLGGLAKSFDVPIDAGADPS